MLFIEHWLYTFYCIACSGRGFYRAAAGAHPVLDGRCLEKTINTKITPVKFKLPEVAVGGHIQLEF